MSDDGFEPRASRGACEGNMVDMQKMSDVEKAELINAYIVRYSQLVSLTDENVFTYADANFCAYEKFADLVTDRPTDAFDVILGTLAMTDNEAVLDNLAAGPLEDLVRMHGEQFIERIEAQACRDKKFRDLLNGVWEVGAPHVWARIEKLQKQTDQ